MPEPIRLNPPALLFLDAETSGLWKSNLAWEDSQQPWIVSCGAALCSADGEMQNFFRFLIKPEGRSIQANAEKVHGISPRVASQFGIPEARFLGIVADLLKTMPFQSWIRVVTYGEFDRNVLSSLFMRFALSQNPPKPASAYNGLWKDRPLVEFIDLMQPWAQQLCKLPPVSEGMDYKWPTLDEAATIILGREPRTGHHNAWEDMLILRDLYLSMKDRGLF